MAYHSPNIHNTAAPPAKTQRPLRVSQGLPVCAKGEGAWNPLPVAVGEPRCRSARLARARGRHCPTNMHTHESAALPRTGAAPAAGAGGSPGV